ELRVGKHAVRNEATARAFVSSGQVLPNNAEVIAGYVRELRAPGTIAHGPHVGSSGLQSIVDGDEAAPVQRYAGLVEPDIPGVGPTPGREQNLTGLGFSLGGRRARTHTQVLAGTAMHVEHRGLGKKLDAFFTQGPLHLDRDVGILPPHRLRPRLDDGDAA